MSERGRYLLELSEQYADGLLDKERRRQVEEEDIGAVDGQRTDHQADMAAWFTLESNVMIAASASASSASGAIEIEAWQQGADYRTAGAVEAREQVQLLRDIFGNPFRPPPPLPPAVLAWNDRTVLRLAEAAYDDRRLPEGTLDPSRLGILSDALLDARCEAEELLSHLRSTGPHYRGCWGVDLLLGRS